MEHLRELRQKRGVSQRAVADYLGITRQAYSNYENGNREPDYETLLKLAEYFAVSVDALLRGTETKKPAPHGGGLTELECELVDGFRRLNMAGKDFIMQCLYTAQQAYTGDDGATEAEGAGLSDMRHIAGAFTRTE